MSVAVLSGAILALATIIALAPLTSAIETANIGILPANPRDDNPRTSSIFVHEMELGQSAEDGVTVLNNSNEEKTLLVYPVDTDSASDGAFACAQKAQQATAVGSWIKLAKERVTLAPNTSETIPFTITLPASGVDVGEHNGCIAVQEDEPAEQNNGNGIVLSFRSALRVAILVPGEVNAHLSFTDIIREITASKVTVSPIIENQGNVSVDANLKVRLTNIFGMDASSSDGTFAVLSDQTSRFNIELDRPYWGGFYKQHVSATYQPLRFTDSTDGKSDTINADSEWVFIQPSPTASLIIVGGLIAIAATIIALLWRRRNYKLMTANTSSYTVKTDDNLQSIAATANISWKSLAKINGIKPPYTLTTGQKIKVPAVYEKASRPKKSS